MAEQNVGFRRVTGRFTGFTLAILLLAPRSLLAYSLLPLTAEMAPTLPSGHAEAILGISYDRNMRFPAFTPAGTIQRQSLTRAPQFSFRIGAGDWAEIQASYEMLYLDESTTDGETRKNFGPGDARLATKVHILRERRWLPAFGLHFGTKLPDANRRNRLGTDDTDFWFDAVLSKDLEVVDVHANLGIFLLGNSGSTIGNTFNAGGQDDLFTYILAVTSKPMKLGESLVLRGVGEITGWTGSRYDNDRSNGRLGVQLGCGPGTFYAGVSVGFVTGSEDYGASAGYIYSFEPGRWFE